MAWTEPKTDWEPSDPITHNDYNRIKNNLVYLNAIYNELYGTYPFEPGSDMGIDEMFRASTWNMFEDCVEHFQRSGVIYTYGERSYYEDNGRLPDYNQLNRLEKCIESYSNYESDVTGVNLTPPKYVCYNDYSDLPITPDVQFVATITPVNAFNKNVSFSSNNTAVATVDEYGHCRVLSGGEAAITVTTEDGGFTATSHLYSVISIESAEITGTLNVEVGENLDISQNVSYSPSQANYISYEYLSSDQSVFTVNSSGVITGVSEGTATLTVRIIQGGEIDETPFVTVVTKEVTVELVIIPVTGITLNKTIIGMDKGGSYTLVATVTPANATNKNVTWSSNYPTMVSVNSNGVLVANNNNYGKAVITATTEDGGFTATCEAYVKIMSEGTCFMNKTIMFALVYADSNTAHMLSEHLLPVNLSDYTAKKSYGNNGYYQYSDYYSNLHYSCMDVWNNIISSQWRSKRSTVYKKYKWSGSSFGGMYFDVIEPSCSEAGVSNVNDSVTTDYGSRLGVNFGEGIDLETDEYVNDYPIPTRTSDLTNCYALRMVRSGGNWTHEQTSYSVNAQQFQFHQPLVFIKSNVKVYTDVQYEGAYIIDWNNTDNSETLLSLFNRSGASTIIDVCDPPNEIREELGIL